MAGALKAIDSDFTDFHVAVKDSKYTLTLTLLWQGVDLNAQSLFERTALHFAAMSIRKNGYSPIIYQILIHKEGLKFICFGLVEQIPS